MLRAVLNREVNRYEIHRGFLYVQVWGGGNDWWHLYPEHALRFLTPEIAIASYREYIQSVRDEKKEKHRFLKEEKRRNRHKYEIRMWFW